MRSIALGLGLVASLGGCVRAGQPATEVPDPEGRSRRDPSSLHAHQHDWPAACREGAVQSPITIASAEFADEESSAIVTHFGTSEVALVDVGHTLQLRMTRTDDEVVFEGTRFALRQLHFHKPSEHIVDGQQAEMELHAVFVAEGDAPRVLVLGYPIVIGDENATLVPLFSRLEDREGYGEDLTERRVWERAMETRELDTSDLAHGETVIVASAPFELASLLPRVADFFVYEGSLTTPDCAEGITHAVASTPITLSDEQIERYEGYYEGNNRDIQPGGAPAARRRRRAHLE